MPANEFEKQVQVIMEDLKLPPSPPVWENIEEQIRKKKDRRRVIFWLLFLFLILSGGLWLTIGINDNRSNSQKAKLEQKDATNPGATPNLSQKNQNTIIDKQNESISSNTNSQGHKKTTITNKLIKKRQPKNGIAVKRPATKRMKKEESSVSVVTKQNETVEIKQHTEQEKTSMVSAQKDDKQSGIVNDQPVKTEAQIIDESKQTSVIRQNLDSTVETTKSLSQINPTEQKSKRPKTNKWKKQITAEIGWSGYGYGFFGGGQKSYSVASPLNSPYSGAVYAPQQTTKGLAAAFGFEWLASLSKRFEISFGLQYHYLSTRTKTGAVVEKDSTIRYQADMISISRYYKNGNQSDYTNWFHVLEIPITVQYRLFKNIPVDIGLGISYGHLLKTNALSFNNQSNIYYRNKKDYTSDFINIFSSLQYEWLHKTKFSIRSGPTFYYSVTGLQRSNSYGSPHLLSVGMKTSIKF